MITYVNYWYSLRVKGGRKCLIFYAPKSPRELATAKQCIYHFASLWVAGRAARPHPRRPASRPPCRACVSRFLLSKYTNKDSLAARRGSPEPAPTPPSRQPGRARGGSGRAGPGRGGGTSWAAGRVRGLGPHERRLRPSLQPREQGPGFKGRLQTNPCYPQDARASAEPRARTRQPAPRLRPGVRGALST